MANYASNNTRRAKLTYQGPTGKHSCLFRFGTDVTANDARAALQVLVPKIAAMQYNQYVWTGFAWADKGDNTFTDGAWEPITATGNDQPQPLSATANFFSFGGKSNADSRWFVEVHGYAFNLVYPWRILAANSAVVNALMDALDTLNPRLASVDGLTTFFKPYININMDDRIVSAARN